MVNNLIKIGRSYWSARENVSNGADPKEEAEKLAEVIGEEIRGALEAILGKSEEKETLR